MSIPTFLYDQFFRRTHATKLIYNTCWEDPRSDRALLKFGSDSRIAMITSAGCNALEYLLDDPSEIHAIDVNYRQNALLELKIAAIITLNYRDFFQIFGQGTHPKFGELYDNCMRPVLSRPARQFWDRMQHFFAPNRARKSFYFYGASGDAAWYFKRYMQLFFPKQLAELHALFDSTNSQQQARYEAVEAVIFSPVVRWLIRQPVFLSLLGVPRAQRDLIEGSVDGGTAAYIQTKLRRVFSASDLSENYFWQLYLNGRYSPTCCPNYLREENFATLKTRVSRIKLHTCTVEQFLQALPSERCLTHVVLLDHQDWMANYAPEALASEWRLLLERGAPGCRYLLRSAAPSASFMPDFVRKQCIEDRQLANFWHSQDRVGTYGCTWLGEKLADVSSKSEPLRVEARQDAPRWNFSEAYSRTEGASSPQRQ